MFIPVTPNEGDIILIGFSLGFILKYCIDIIGFATRRRFTSRLQLMQESGSQEFQRWDNVLVFQISIGIHYQFLFVFRTKPRIAQEHIGADFFKTNTHLEQFFKLIVMSCLAK